MTSNYPTQLALAFHEHEQDLFGLPEVVRVEVAYTFNALKTEIADVIVVGRDGKTVAWTYSLMDAADGVVPLPMPAVLPEMIRIHLEEFGYGVEDLCSVLHAQE